MATGNMSTDANYPDNNGLQLETLHSISGGASPGEPYGVLTIGGVPGTGASYKLQELVSDAIGTQWVDTKSASFSGNGAAATGQLTARLTGQAVRLVAANGTTPGTGGNTPNYSLEVMYLTTQERRRIDLA